MTTSTFFIYLIVMAGITYLLRALPFALISKKIENKRVNSFLFYLPYTVLACMTFPAIIDATNSYFSALVGMLVAILFAIKEKSLITVASVACIAVFICEFIV